MLSNAVAELSCLGNQLISRHSVKIGVHDGSPAMPLPNDAQRFGSAAGRAADRPLQPVLRRQRTFGDEKQVIYSVRRSLLLRRLFKRFFSEFPSTLEARWRLLILCA